MKNATLFLVLILTFSVFVSCSKDNTSENQLVIKKVTEEVFYSNSSDVSIQTFIYENNKFIKSIGSDGKYVSFIYDGEKVLKINRHSVNNEITGVTNFIYEGENLIRVEGDSGNSVTLLSYQNGKLIKRESGYNTPTGFNVQDRIELIYDSNNNNSEKTNAFYGQTNNEYKSLFFYDDKINPTRYMNKYLRLIFSTEGFDGLSQNNIINQEVYSPISNITPTKYKYEYIFNADNYPTTIKRLTQSGTLISNTTIEYQSN